MRDLTAYREDTQRRLQTNREANDKLRADNKALRAAYKELRNCAGSASGAPPAGSGSPSGAVDSGEAPDDAVRRRVCAETASHTADGPSGATSPEDSPELHALRAEVSDLKAKLALSPDRE